MASTQQRRRFIADLRRQIGRHRVFLRDLVALEDEALQWQPAAGAWNALQCVDHLVETHEWYWPRLDAALQDAPAPRDGAYKPSFWGRVYMYFAFDSRFSFRAPAPTVPAATPSRQIFTRYGDLLDRLSGCIGALSDISLRRTRIPIAPGIHFNLGDCLLILVRHDRMHLHQAREAVAHLRRGQLNAEQRIRGRPANPAEDPGV